MRHVSNVPMGEIRLDDGLVVSSLRSVMQLSHAQMRPRLSLALRRVSFTPVRSFSSSALAKMRVVPVPVRSDNYAYLLIDDKVNKALAVDAFDVSKVQEAAKKEGVELVGKLTTHHHFDHSGGNEVCPQLLYSQMHHPHPDCVLNRNL